jgi:hypothetical protein
MTPIIEVCDISRDASAWAAITGGQVSCPWVARINDGRGSGLWPGVVGVIGPWRPLGVAATARMALLLVGAVITHRRGRGRREGDGAGPVASALTIACLVIVLGAWTRANLIKCCRQGIT